MRSLCRKRQERYKMRLRKKRRHWHGLEAKKRARFICLSDYPSWPDLISLACISSPLLLHSVFVAARNMACFFATYTPAFPFAINLVATDLLFGVQPQQKTREEIDAERIRIQEERNAAAAAEERKKRYSQTNCSYWIDRAKVILCKDGLDIL